MSTATTANTVQQSIMKLIFEALTLLYFTEFLNGDIYCSNSTKPIDCQPCSDICENKTETCKNNNLHSCPLNCDRQVKCNYVCCEYCLDDKCVYTDAGQVMCSEGCFPRTTGLCCREPCPPACKECDQFNSSCSSCYEGLSGEYCNETITVDVTSSMCRFQSASCEGKYSNCCSDYSTSIDTSNWYKYLLVLPTIILIICLAVFIQRRYCNKLKQRDSCSYETHLITQPTEAPRRRESCPYVDIKVIDRDLVPDHLLQAAMITAPPLSIAPHVGGRIWLNIEED